MRPILLDWTFRSRRPASALWYDTGKIVRVSEGGERTRGVVGGASEPRLSLQANWLGSWAAVTVALQRTRRSGLAGDLCRDAAAAGGAGRSRRINMTDAQRCARHRADDAGRALSSGACEDASQSETADAADPSQSWAAVEGDRPSRTNCAVLCVSFVSWHKRGQAEDSEGSRDGIKSWSRTYPTWPFRSSNRCSLSWRVLREQIGVLHRRLAGHRCRRRGLRAPARLNGGCPVLVP